MNPDDDPTVTAAREKASMADVDLHYAVDRLFQCPTFYPDGAWDDAYMRARDAWERSNAAEKALSDAKHDARQVAP